MGLSTNGSFGDKALPFSRICKHHPHMKILLCSCVPFWDFWKEGGGVAVYVNNLIPALSDRGHDVSFLSYGFKTNPLKHAPYIRESHNPYSQTICRSYDLIHSPVPAPSRTHSNNPQLSISPRPELEQCIVDFIRKQGGYDIIHFHSLEGITPQVLKALRHAFPATGIFYSAHDYYPFCVGVRLYQETNRQRCECYHDGQTCLGCIPEWDARALQRHAAHYYKDPYNKVSMPGFLRRILIRHSGKRNDTEIHRIQATAQDYKAYRETYIEHLNQYTDGILAVSRRVGQIYEHMGISHRLIKLSYIGTRVAEHQKGYQVTPGSLPLNLLFMGAATAPEKGFPFLLDALASLSPETAAKLNFTIAAAGTDPQQLKECLKHLNSYKVYEGYTHDQLQDIMQNIHLGIVPVVWEDNLPQVAIEMVAHGVAVLASDAGGASELTTSAHFRFRCGDQSDFITKLTQIIRQPDLLSEYWAGHSGLTTMQQHAEQLEHIYRQNKP